MSEWKTYKLGELATIKGGKRLPKGVLLQSTPNSHPYIRIRDLGKTRILELDSTYEYVDDLTQKSIARYIVEKGDILLSIVGTIGLVGIVGESLHLANQTENCVKLINLNKVDRLYLYYYLSSKIGQIEIHKGIVGAVQAKLPIKNIENIEISLPPLAEQKRIADILSAIDDKIELNRRINANLEQQAQALYKSWFVDNKKDDWEEVELGDIATILAGGDKPEIYVDKQTDDCKVPIYSNGIDNEGLFGYTRCAKIYEHSITISARGTIGFVCLRTEPYVPIVRLISVIPQYNNLSAEYLYLWAITQNISGTGTTQQQLTIPYFKKTKIIIPNQELLIKFNKVISPIFITLKKNKTENNNLSILRDTLLPKLMSGEIKV